MPTDPSSPQPDDIRVPRNIDKETQVIDGAIHDKSCELVQTAGFNGPCTCPNGPWIRQGALPPIIATVQAGDSLIFLVGDSPEPLTMERMQRMNQHLGPYLEGVKFTFVPAVGVVHMPAPILEVVEPKCLAIYQRPGMKGFRQCVNDPDHLTKHRDSQGFEWHWESQ